MINNLKNKYNFQLRLATKDEIDELAESLARKNWLDSEKYLKSIAKDIKETMATDFISRDKNNILELIGDKVLVQDYKKHEVSIFVYNYIQEYEENVITSLTFRVLRSKKGMELLQDEDVVFNLKDLQTKPYHTDKEKSGRPKRPRSESIQKAIEVKRHIENNPVLNIGEICQEFGFSKTTYYRVMKWLAGRNL